MVDDFIEIKDKIRKVEVPGCLSIGMYVHNIDTTV